MHELLECSERLFEFLEKHLGAAEVFKGELREQQIIVLFENS